MLTRSSAECLEGGALLLVPGISGSGKTTAARHLVEHLNQNGEIAQLVVPHTTRPKREREAQGVDYFFHSTEDYLHNYAARCADPNDDWVVSEINGCYYFNQHSATAPNQVHPIKILPVAYSAYQEVADEHAAAVYSLCTLPIAIGKDLRSSWLGLIAGERPGRNLVTELRQQDDFLSHYHGEIFWTTWNLAEDLQEFNRRARIILAVASSIVNATIGKELE